jgi:quercetin dioxygenase-like cupin family protein
MEYFYNWDDQQAEAHGRWPSPCDIKAITGKDLQLVWAIIRPGGTYVMHKHPHEQFSILLQGRMLLHVGGQEKELGPGEMWYAPPDTIHGGKLLGEGPVVFVDIFHPIREDIVEEMKRNRAERVQREAQAGKE